eukprot:scaffold79989_cov31-Phaeocystis_antarctica.AAC.2
MLVPRSADMSADVCSSAASCSRMSDIADDMSATDPDRSGDWTCMLTGRVRVAAGGCACNASPGTTTVRPSILKSMLGEFAEAFKFVRCGQRQAPRVGGASSDDGDPVPRGYFRDSKLVRSYHGCGER